jgi:hypothetical protein
MTQQAFGGRAGRTLGAGDCRGNDFFGFLGWLRFVFAVTLNIELTEIVFVSGFVVYLPPSLSSRDVPLPPPRIPSLQRSGNLGRHQEIDQRKLTASASCAGF